MKYRRIELQASFLLSMLFIVIDIEWKQNNGTYVFIIWATKQESEDDNPIEIGN